MAGSISLCHLRADILQGIRTLAKSPRFTIPALAIITLGIFIATLVFSIFDAVVLKALPYPHADRMVALFGKSERAGGSQFPLSRNEIDQLQSDAGIFDRVGYYVYLGDKHLTDGDASSRIGSLQVSPDFFRVFEMEPVLGHAFRLEEFQPGKNDSVIIAYGLWQRQFSSDPQVIGRIIHLDGAPYTIVGVMPEGFRFPTTEVRAWFPDPVSSLPDKNADKMAVARVRPGSSPAQVQAALGVVSSRLRQGPFNRPVFRDFTISAINLRDQVVGTSRKILLLLLLAVALVQFIVCANVTNLLLARNALRKKEVAIRIALGASRLRVIQELLIESFVLGMAGCVLGLILAAGGIHVVRITFAQSLDNCGPLVMDFFVLSASLALSTFLGIAFGLLPAIRATAVSPNRVLQEGSSGSRAGFRLLRGHRLQSVLTASQITLALVLLIGFGLLFRSLSKVMNVEMGFNPRKLIAIQFGTFNRSGPQAIVALNQVLSNIRQLPSVRSASISSLRPFLGVSIATLFSAQATDGAWVTSPAIEAQAVSSDYFSTLQVPVISGRTFSDRDTHDSPCVVVVSSALARIFWADGNPLDRQIDLNGGFGTQPAICRVIGVVSDVKDVFLQGTGHPEIYFHFAQRNLGTHAMLIRTDENGLVSITEVLHAVHAIDGSLDADSVASLDQLISNSAYQPRLRATVLGLFAMLAVALAITGLYGVTSYSVGQRTKEFGIRVALGATRANLAQLVLQDCIVLIGVGVVVGSVVALAVTRSFASMLYEVKPADLLTYASTGALLTVVALAASCVPLRRVTKLSPNVALREE
jgi:predicted permease